MAELELSSTAGADQTLDEASTSRINHDFKEGTFRIFPVERIKSVRVDDDTDLVTLIDPAGYHGFALAESMAAGVTSGLGVHNINSVNPQGNNDGEVLVGIPPANEHVDVPTGVVLVSRSLIGGSVVTLGMVIATALYRPAKGPLFGRNPVIYYIALSCIFLWGLAHASAGIWLSRSREVSNRRFKFAKILLVMSLLPFCAIIGIGGLAFLQT